jgi:hypothetical protein
MSQTAGSEKPLNPYRIDPAASGDTKPREAASATPFRPTAGVWGGFKYSAAMMASERA